MLIFKGWFHTHTDRCERFMTHAVEMGSGAMIYIIPSVVKIGSGNQKLMGGGYRDTQTAW
jgi:hypothetical protein